MEPEKKTPEETSNLIAEKFFGVGPDPAERKPVVIRLMVSALVCAVLVPGLFYLRFGEVGDLGWGMTIFFVVYCLLAAVGLYFGPRREFHTPVPLRGDWVDGLGAFWLVSCVFGPFFGWVLTSIAPITQASWRWVYGLRFILGAGLPLLTALPLLRYVRGKSAWIALPILVGVTMLATWSVTNVGRDLLAGPLARQIQSSGQVELILRYTAQSLGIAR
jgi:hypothetical protein